MKFGEAKTRICWIKKRKENSWEMLVSLLIEIMKGNLRWLSDWVSMLRSLGTGRGAGRRCARFVCCSRSATAELIVRQRGVASELTNSFPGAITATESLERAMSEHLPPGDNLSTTLTSPQFSQALSIFWSALQSGQASAIVRQFGLGPEAVNAADRGNLEAFVSAVETEVKAGQQQSSSSTPAQQQQQQPKETISEEDKTKKSSPPSGAPSSGANSAKKDDDDEGMALD